MGLFDGLTRNQLLRRQIGEEGNAWDDEQTGEDGFSKVVDTKNLPHVSIMGVIDADSSIKFYASQDGIRFYFCKQITDDIDPEPIPDVPEWETSTNYKVGDMVEKTINGSKNIYTCLTNHRSGTFDDDLNADKWELTFENIDNEENDFKEFHIFETIGARYIRLQSSNDVKATVTIAAKP